MTAVAEQRSNELPLRAVRALEETDMMPGPLRACVHEFGYAIVKACVDMGIKEPRHIRHIVHEIWRGARQPHQRQHLHTPRSERSSSMLDHLDWLMIQSGSKLGAAALLRVLWAHNLVIVPLAPSDTAVAASMEEVANFDQRVTKYEKHRRRLKAAMEAQAKKLWPHLFRRDA